MLSAGMLTDFASATIVRSRGLLSGSPPPARAATVSSLMMRVKTLPRLASAAPFLCLIVCHLEWPDMVRNSSNYGEKWPGYGITRTRGGERPRWIRGPATVTLRPGPRDRTFPQLRELLVKAVDEATSSSPG